MASQFQEVIYEGYLGADPDMRYLESGKAVTNFRVASTRVYYKGEGENKEQVQETTWLKVAAWGKLAEIVNNLAEKGSHVLVRGTLRVGENGSPTPFQLKDGTWAASYELNASEVRVFSKSSRDEQGDNSPEDSDEAPF